MKSTTGLYKDHWFGHERVKMAICLVKSNDNLYV